MVFALYFYCKAPNMTNPKAIAGLLAVFFGLFSSPNNAQVNVKTGYSISLVSDPAVNDILDQYNSFFNYTKELKNLKWMHGFEAGIRYKSGPHAFELSYMGAYRNFRGYFTNPNGGNDIYDKIGFDVHAGGLGYQVSDGFFGIGTDIQYQWYVTKGELILPYRTFKDVQTMWATKLYLMLTLQGSSNVHFVLEPYYVLPFDGYDARPLQQFLGTADVNYPRNKWDRWGISLLFYNGYYE